MNLHRAEEILKLRVILTGFISHLLEIAGDDPAVYWSMPETKQWGNALF